MAHISFSPNYLDGPFEVLRTIFYPAWESSASYSPKNIWQKFHSISMHKHVLIVDDQSFE